MLLQSNNLFNPTNTGSRSVSSVDFCIPNLKLIGRWKKAKKEISFKNITGGSNAAGLVNPTVVLCDIKRKLERERERLCV
jgi:hypothetical protein